MRISLASDHGGFLLKQAIIRHLEGQGISCLDYGTTNSTDSVDYPDFVKPACDALVKKSVDYAIVVCTTGIGVSIVANKQKGVRCALVTNSKQAELTRLHNDANCLALGAINQTQEEAINFVDIFLKTKFSGEERHQRRIDKIE